jgi:hypothetical protein
MIQTPFDALLITPVSCAMLPAPPLSPALCAAVSLPAIAAHANPKHQPAIRIATKPLPENNFPVNRHPHLQAAFDNGCGSCQRKTTRRLLSALA